VLLVSLVFSVVLIGLAHLAARKLPKRIRAELFVVGGFFILFAPAGGFLLLPANFFLYFALGAALVAWWYRRNRGHNFRRYSAVAFASVYAVAIGIAGYFQFVNAEFRSKYPIESMEERLQPSLVKAPPGFESSWSNVRLAAMEKDAQEANWKAFYREHVFREIHESTIQSFVNSPSFGVGRMIYLPSDGVLRKYRTEAPPAQPGIYSSSTSTILPSVRDDAVLNSLHKSAILDFSNPLSFGMIESRNRVAGFQPHGFTKVPTPDNSWKLQTIELLGVLLHPEPVVYLSARLPAMDELKVTPTRPPDTFERAALQMLKKGDDLVTAEMQDGGRMRMLGSLRNGTTCMKCHGGERGDLLGAFSYILSSK
jgi:hypothetical protein